MAVIPTDRDRSFWNCAASFPPNKEEVYAPHHAEAHEFDLHAGKRILEYGCGGGSDAMSFIRRGCAVTYTDIVPGNVATARLRIQQAFDMESGSDGIVLVNSNEIPVPDASFDVVSSHGVVHHIKDPFPVVNEFYRILKPGGLVYIMLYSEQLRAEGDAHVQRFMQHFGITEAEAFGYFTDGVGTPHAIPYTEQEGWDLIEFAGFERRDCVMSNGDRFRTFRARKP